MTAQAARSSRASSNSTSASFVLLGIVLFAYLLWFRTHGVSETFWLYGDQVRDWSIALRPFGELPLVGPPSLAGGNTAGPSYYWFLWLVANTIGRFCADLPHAGGIGISVLQSCADILLLYALAKRLQSTLLALVIVGVVATSGHDATISSTIWNPPVAIGLVKIAIALALLGTMGLRTVVGVSATAWLAVQAHTTALPLAVPLLVAIAFVGTTRRGEVLGRGLTICGVIALLQVPWLVHVLRGGPSATPTPMLESLTAVIRDPLGAPQLLNSASATMRAIAYNTGTAIAPAIAAVWITLGALALSIFVKDTLLRLIAVGPLVCAIALFAVWQGSLNENYWFLALALPATLCAFGWLAAVPQPAARLAALCALGVLLYLQPSQARLASSSLRTPIYGALVAGSRGAVASDRPIREIRTQFDMPPGVDASYIYRLLGGRLASDARERAVIDRAGGLVFEAVQ